MRKGSKPAMLIACGLTGTGKSTILNDVAKKMGIEILTSDRMRKELAQIPPGEHRYVPFDSDIYSAGFTEKTYLFMIEEGKKLLLEGKSVILDACFPKRWQRQKARESAESVQARFLCIEFTAPEAEVRRRLEKRYEAGKDVSDGRWEIFLAQKGKEG